MKSKLYIKDWLHLKPYDTQKKTDGYYLRISNKVRKVFDANIIKYTLLRFLEKDSIDELACFLTSYFEDIISDTGLWKAFVNNHIKLYNRDLPFYNLNEYVEEEINIQDVSFLIWYYINMNHDKVFVSPFNDFIFEIAERIMEVFDEAWEYAPENKALQDYYTLEKSETNYFKVRDLIDRILLESYLFIDTRKERAGSVEGILKKKEEAHFTLALLNHSRDVLLHTSYTALLALSGKEWAAEIIGDDHPLSADIRAMSKRVEGWFFYKGQDENSIFLEHIATSKKFELTKDSFEHTDSININESMVYIGIVRWQDKWWFSGINFQKAFDADLVREEKNNVRSRNQVNFVNQDTSEFTDILKTHFKAFLQYNHGSQVAFMPSSQVDSFLNGFTDAVAEYLEMTDEAIEEADARSRQQGFDPDQSRTDFEGDSDQEAMVFFNPQRGLEINFEVNSAFPLPNNPYYDPSKRSRHTFRLFMKTEVSPQLVNFCLDNCGNDLSDFISEYEQKYLPDLDFLLRFWKKEDYHVEPSVTFIGDMKKVN